MLVGFQPGVVIADLAVHHALLESESNGRAKIGGVEGNVFKVLAAARLSCFERAEVGVREVLREKLEKCVGVTDDIERFLEADFDFHYTIAKFSKNDLLLQSMYVVPNSGSCPYF